MGGIGSRVVICLGGVGREGVLVMCFGVYSVFVLVFAFFKYRWFYSRFLGLAFGVLRFRLVSRWGFSFGFFFLVLNEYRGY